MNSKSGDDSRQMKEHVSGGLKNKPPIAYAFLPLIVITITSAMVGQSHCRAVLASLDFFGSVFYQGVHSKKVLK